MLRSPELPKIKNEKEFTSEQVAIDIQRSFLESYPALKAVWAERYEGPFSKFFEKNQELFIQLHKDPERRSDLYEIIKSELLGDSGE